MIAITSICESKEYSADSLCIFRQPWWLDIFNELGAVNVVTVTANEHQSITLPYLLQNKFGWKVLTMPPFTQSAGPMIWRSDAAAGKQSLSDRQLMDELIAGLPKFDVFKQNFHSSVIDWLPWYWKGYQQRTRYTYIIDDLSDPATLWKNVKPNIKGDIKKAKNRFDLTVKTDLSMHKFIDILEMTFTRQNLSLPYPRELFVKLDAACAAQGRRKIFYAEDNSGQIHAVAYIVWDNQSAYYLMGGGDPKLRNSGASSLLLWEAILFSSTVSKAFDFEGSMIEPVERFFRGFGGKQVPYFQIWKFNSPIAFTIYSITELWKLIVNRLKLAK